MNNKWITYKHLERLLTHQPYYVWHFDQSDLLKNLNDEILENEIDSENFWEIDIDLDDEKINDYKFVEIIKNGFSHVNKKFYEQTKLQAKYENVNLKIVNEKSIERSILKTQEYLNDDSVDWILNPIFIYDNDVKVNPSIYKKNTNTISTLLHSTKSKLINYVRAYFEVCALENLSIPVLNYTFYIYDKNWIYTEGNDLKFVEYEYAWTSKSGPQKAIKTSIEKHNKNKRIIDKINSSIIKDSKDVEKVLIINKNNFQKYINKIRESQFINKPEKLNKKDVTDWGKNPFFKELFPFVQMDIPRVCGYLLSADDLLEIAIGKETSAHVYAIKNKILELVLNQRNQFNFDKINECINKLDNTTTVWYDFEGFNLPYATIPYSKPYQQIVFQVSVIKTINNQIIDVNNVVVDPKTISHKDFIKIIDSIYSKDAQNYVVYNKGYENSRLQEMIEILSFHLSEAQIKEYKFKINHILSNTYDLYDMFKVTKSKTKIPPIFLWELLGFSSIKKIENFITIKNMNLEVMIKPYKELQVQNGLMAMNQAIQRYLNVTGDNEWNENVVYLKQYCENDVKAMIMVYFFIKRIYDNNIKKQ